MMLNKYLILLTSGLIAFSAYSFADEEKNENQLFACDCEKGHEENQSSDSSEEKTLVASEDSETTEESQSIDSYEKTLWAACGNGKCPKEMIEKLRQEKKQSEGEQQPQEKDTEAAIV